MTYNLVDNALGSTSLVRKSDEVFGKSVHGLTPTDVLLVQFLIQTMRGEKGSRRHRNIHTDEFKNNYI